MASFKFIHAADLHLDAPFAGASADRAEVGSALARATYEAFDRVVDECVRRGVDFLVIAGDAYNSRDKSLRAQMRFQERMLRLAEAGVEVFIAQGNHDPANGWTANLDLPETVHVFPTDRVARFEVVRSGDAVCAVYGRGFAKAAETSNLAKGYRREDGDPFAVGVLHTNVGARTDYEPYAPCVLQDLCDAGMDYWALGHIHKPDVLRDSSPRVAYAGSPQGLNPKERGRHGCWAVTVTDGRMGEPEFVDTASVTWDEARIDASDCPGIESLRARLRDECSRMREEAGMAVIARLEVCGRSAVHSDLSTGSAASDLLEAMRDEQMGADPWLWIDRLRDVTAPELDLEAVRTSSNFAADVAGEADSLIADEETARAFVAAAAEPLAELLGDVGDPAEMVARARDICLDRLLAGEEAS